MLHALAAQLHALAALDCSCNARLELGGPPALRPKKAGWAQAGRIVRVVVVVVVVVAAAAVVVVVVPVVVGAVVVVVVVAVVLVIEVEIKYIQ